MGGRHSSTDQIFTAVLDGNPSPNVIYPVGDVRDLAHLHVLAMGRMRRTDRVSSQVRGDDHAGDGKDYEGSFPGV